MSEREARSGDFPLKGKASVPPWTSKLGADERRVKYRPGTKPGPRLRPRLNNSGGTHRQIKNGDSDISRRRENFANFRGINQKYFRWVSE